MQEKVLMEGVANPLSKNGFATKNGHGVLTTKRFIYSKHSLAKIFVIGIFVNATKGTYDYELPMEDIASADTGKHLLGHAMTIIKKDGTTLKYGIMKPLDWKIAWGNAMNQDTAEEPPQTQVEPETQDTKKFCSSCGAKATGDGRFCSNCGAKL